MPPDPLTLIVAELQARAAAAARRQARTWRVDYTRPGFDADDGDHLDDAA